MQQRDQMPKLTYVREPPIAATKVLHVTPQEHFLITWLREHVRYGDITVDMQGGQPYRIIKAYDGVKVPTRWDEEIQRVGR